MTWYFNPVPQAQTRDTTHLEQRPFTKIVSRQRNCQDCVNGSILSHGSHIHLYVTLLKSHTIPTQYEYETIFQTHFKPRVIAKATRIYPLRTTLVMRIMYSEIQRFIKLN